MAAAKSLNEALLNVQKNAPAIQKDAINPAFGRGSKYISLDGLMPIILPLLNAENILLSQAPSNIDGEPALTTILTHVPSEDTVSYTMPLILDKNTAQGQGSAITYAKRYSILGILALVADTDDDGNKASEKEVEVVNRRSTRTTRKSGDDSRSSVVNDTDEY